MYYCFEFVSFSHQCLGRAAQNTIKLDLASPGKYKFLTYFYSFTDSFTVHVLFPPVLPYIKINPYKALALIYAFIQKEI